MARRSRTCPGCGARTVPIIFGMPFGELFERAERGEVVLGGCRVTSEDPTRVCKGDPPHSVFADGRYEEYLDD
ncbi:MAG: hypothetical protein WCI12_05740 [Actinomycetes bacterium]